MNNFQENNIQAGDEAEHDAPLPNDAAAAAALRPQRAHAATYEPDSDADAEAEAEVYGAQRQPADSWRLNADGVWTTEEN